MVFDWYRMLFVWGDFGKKVPRSFYPNNEKEAQDLIFEYNVNQKLAVGFCLNSCPQKIRKGDKIPNINNILIDLDFPKNVEKNIDEYDKIIRFLEEKNISIWYSEESLNGYHVVIPVFFQDINITKDFLIEAKKVSEFVDEKVFLKTQICRCFESTNYKNKNGFKLKFLKINERDECDIEKNNIAIKEIFYNKQDFFINLLNNKKLQIELRNRTEIHKNNVLLKNLAIYLNKNKGVPEIEEKIFDLVSFLNHSKREFMGWVEKDLKYVNYKELYLWAEKFSINCKINIDSDEENFDSSILGNIKVYILDEESDKYFLEENHNISRHTKTGLLENLYVKLLKEGSLDIDLNPTKSKNIIYKFLLKKIETYNGMTYKPVDEKIIYKDSNKYLNTFKESDLLKSLKEEFENRNKLFELEFDIEKKLVNYKTL